ncbi:MAG: SurA N-terminal domain-containing protein [Candidatus Hydrogenedentes bacterium]|nr:SurA N-terminal domain-containing protein [Candidatus Hydrogenedentota bacterium]
MKTLFGHIGLALVLAVGASAYGETVDGVVATVGTEVILHSELVEQISPALNDLHQKVANEEQFNEKANVLLRQALEDAIDSKILLREALLAGIDVDKSLVEERVVEVKKRFASDAEFEQEMAKAGETIADLRERVKKQILHAPRTRTRAPGVPGGQAGHERTGAGGSADGGNQETG